MKTLAIFGATGAQGAPVVREALARGLRTRAVARNADRVAQMHPDAEPYAASLSDPEAVQHALKGVDAAFVHLPMPSGPNDAENWLKTVIGAAHAVSLPLMVYTTSGPTGARYASSATVDGATAGMEAVAACGIPSIILQPALYLENLKPELFLPKLRSQGVLDYPPLPPSTQVQWTSHLDQARIAVAAMLRPKLAGRRFEIGSPGAVTGPELAALASAWLKRDVDYAPLSPQQFGQRIGDALGNPGAAFALQDLYGSLEKLSGDDMVLDTDALESVFDVKLTSVADHLRAWAAPE